MKKIVHITQSMNCGGAEKLICDLSCACSKMYEVHIICQYSEIDNGFAERLENCGVYVHLLDKKVGLDFDNMKKIYALLQKIKPDVVHTHIQSAIYALPWFMFSHKKCVRVHTVHSMPSMEFTKAHRYLQSFAYKHLGVIPVACGETVRRELEKLYKLKDGKARLVFNGVDISHFACEKRKKTDTFTLIDVANFSKWKNQQLLVDVLQYLDDSFKLVLVGDGECRKEVEAKARENGVYDRITFTGKVSNVEEYLAKADVFVLSSLFEGIPLSIVEGFAAGLPVVAVNVGGVPDLLSDGENGFLCEISNPSGMAEKIQLLREDTALYEAISQRNIEKAKSFDISETVRKYTEIYEDGGKE